MCPTTVKEGFKRYYDRFVHRKTDAMKAMKLMVMHPSHLVMLGGTHF